ncbi:phage related protein: putative minor tail protein [Leuconostoc kimchii IMSNU 11154]|uniref:Phage related protein: putative minor tail protein n=1 Tax=Leuconostoc kimchii (strain IMSNU 11154 / KCTC 2386 / IH25) TaxID=762051 RepID=D5T4L3_LEUKI|nr:tape measure protein [Leuconostoc kimchii]ADG41484.1 phage related protein: putative minor tail protein [Leuconostoc kimchii IMSNU 11154]
MADGSINIDLLLNDKSDPTWTEFNAKAEKQGKSGYEKFKDAFKGDPLVAKLEAQADKAGINDFRELLNKLPKEKQTELLAKAEKGEAIDFQKFIKDIPDAKKIMLEAQAKRAGIDNFEELLKKLPKKTLTDLQTRAEKGEVINFEKELRKLPSKVVSTVELNDNASTGLRSLKQQAEEVGDKFHRIKEIAVGTFIGSAVAGGIRTITGFVAGLGQEALSSSDALQKFKSTMQLGGFGEKEIDSATKQVKKYADDTVYDLGTVSNTTAQLAANGVKDYMGLTEAAGNLNAQAGGNAETFKSVAMMLTQTAGAGKLTTENWNQLADAIPGASGVLQKAMKENGAYTGNFRDAMANGQVSADEFNDALTKLGSNDAAKKAATATNTFEGAWGALEANVVSGLDNIIDRIGKDKLTGVINNLAGVATSSFGVVADVIMGVGKAFGVISNGLSMFATSFKYNVLGAVSDGSVGKRVDEIKQSFSGLIDALKPVAQAIGGLFGVITGGIVTTAIKLIQGITDGFIGAGDSADKVKKKFDFSNIFDTIVTISQWLNVWHETLGDIYKPLGEIIGAIGSGVFEVFVDVISDIVGSFKAMIGETKGATENINPVAKALEGIAKHKNALKAIGLAIGSIAVALLAVKGAVGVFKMVSDGITTVRIAIMLFGDAWKALNTIMKANIFVIIVTAVIAVGLAFYELYKHNKKFREFIDGLVKGAADFFKGVGKWFGEAWKTISDFFKKVINFVKDDWKEILLFIVNPFAGAFALLYKHNAKFKKSIDDMLKAVIGFFKGIGKSIGSGAGAIGKWFDGLVKGFIKGWDKFIEITVKLAKGFGKLLLYALAVPVGIAIIIAKPLVEPLKKIFNALISWTKKAWKGLTSFLEKIWDPIQKTWTKSWNAISSLFSKVLNGIKKIFTNAINNIEKVLTIGLKFISKAWSATWNAISNVFGKIWKGLQKYVENELNFWKKIFTAALSFITKLWDRSWDYVSDTFEKIWNGIKKFFKPIIKWLEDVISDALNGIKKAWNRSWDAIFDFFSDTWNSIKRTGSKGINSLKDTLSGVLDKIGKTFSDTWDGIKNGFSAMWDGLKSLAGKGINAVINIPNAGIEGINGLIHDFGGPKSTLSKIPKVAFATGTGAFGNMRRAITNPTMAILNDGNDSPETGNKEALIHPNGAMEIVQGRNTERLLMPGTEVLNASELSMLMGSQHFASGTGFLGSIWDGVKGAGSWVGKTASNAWDGIKSATEKYTKMFGFITNAIAHPVKTLENVFDPKSGGMGNMMNGLATGTFKHVKSQAVDWWKSLWGMANDEASGGGGSSELLKEVIKLGTGKPYVWGATGPDSFDCSGLVQDALRQMGNSFPHYSGDQYNSSTAVSDPKSGDLAFFGEGGSQHVGVYGGNGKMFSAMSPGSNPNIGWAKVSDWSEKLAGYHRVPGLKSDDSKSSSSNPMASLIKGQVGGMFDWIKKFIAPTQDSLAEPAGDGVGRWKDDVTKALGKLGLSTSGGMVSKVLRQIQTESGGNASAMGGNDGLSDGNATGLMQVKPGTFRAYAAAGHTNIMNGYDNILAGLAYAKSRYGSDLSFLGQGHGYANGGRTHGIGIVGEVPGEDEWVTNPNRQTADRNIIGSIKETAQKQPNSFAAKLANIVNGAKSGMQNVMSQQPAIAGGNTFNNNGGVDLSGDVHMTIQMDSGEVARATYPKIKILQNQEIQLKGQTTGNTYGY